MIDTDTIKKYILDGEWEYQYPQAIEYLLAEVKRLRGILGDITAIDEWGGDGKDVGITITYSEGDSFMGWLNKCDDEVIE